QALIAQADQAANPARMQVILAETPGRDDRSWQQQLLRSVPGLVIEGRLGQIVDVVAPPDRAPQLAAMPSVSTVRLPRAALHQDQKPEDPATDVQAVLRDSGIERMHGRGYRGQGVGLAVIDSDFRGFGPFVGRQLPAGTRLVDLTAERSPDVQPDPYSG